MSLYIGTNYRSQQYCQKEFREWLMEKYQTIDNLNKQYWSSFWSHRYNEWDEIESPASHGDSALHALNLDYQRFYSDLSIDFLKAEIDAVKRFNPEIPVTTNMFHLNCGINLHKLAEVLDVITWDSYPKWHIDKDKLSEWNTVVEAAFQYDFCRSAKNQPFLLMEK